jgi:hypothetical protein
MNILQDIGRFLPTVGSVAGGIGGAALGGAADVATLGAAAPFINPITAGIAGAGAGGALGKMGENITQGQSPFQKSDLVAGAEGAGGQALGGIAGGLLGKLGGGLIGKADELTQGAKAVDEATALKNAYADVPKGLRQAYNAAGQTSFVKGLGADATNPQNLIDIGSNANDVLNSNLSDILANNGTVDLSNYNDMVKNAIAKEGNTLGSYDKVAITGKRLAPANTPAAKLLSQLEQQGMGVARTEADPNAVRELLQKVQSAAVDAKPGISATTGAIDPTQKATYNVLNDVVGQLKDSLYNRPEIDQAVSGLKGNIQAADVGGNQALADHLNKVLNGAGSAQDLLSEMSRFTNMGKLGQAAVKAQQDVASPASLARVTGEPVAQVNPGSLATAAGHVATGSPIKAVLHLASASPAKVMDVGGKAANILSRMAPAAGAAVATSPNIVPPSNQPQGAAMAPQDQTNPYLTGAQPTMSPVTMLGAAGLAGIMDPYIAQNYAPMLEQAIPTLQKAAQAQSALQSLEQAFQAAGGGQGRLLGAGSILGGALTGGAPEAYQRSLAQLMPMLNQLGIPSTTPMPSLMNTAPAAGTQFQNIQGLLNAIR